ncbi:hypothetical protein DPSP01_014578 [Paraphaeosphaeria sporulosa]
MLQNKKASARYRFKKAKYMAEEASKDIVWLDCESNTHASPTIARADSSNPEARGNVSPRITSIWTTCMTTATGCERATEPPVRPSRSSTVGVSSISNNILLQREADVDANAISDDAQIQQRSPYSCLDQSALQSPALSLVQPDQNNQLSCERSPERYGSAIWTNRHIRAVLDQQDPEGLETAVARSVEILDELQEKFIRCATSNTDAQSWNEAIEKLKSQAERTRTVVGVVGNTGAGKSSVINAMLNEENLVPTNCMRACTAVVTEISWNDRTDSSATYRAEIEFIDRIDWEEELTALMKDFLNGDGAVSHDAYDSDSVAGIAWAKFQSVYPKVPRDTLNQCNISDLVTRPDILSILGTTKTIETDQPITFYKQLQHYVDSKEKWSKKGKGNDGGRTKTNKHTEMEYWPLIKVVRIYTKSRALSTGAVIVDLPGVHDSNAARAAVAQDYLKNCTGLWIVAPISRAVDDKAAKTFLGSSFGRQLKYDGGFSSVTFICSKTDDISITEAINSLEPHGSAELEEQSDENRISIKKIEDKMKGLLKSQQFYETALSETLVDMDIWEEIEKQLDEGKKVYTPKRRRSYREESPRKRRRVFEEEPDHSSVPSEDDGTDDENKDEVALTTPDVQKKLQELRRSRNKAREEICHVKDAIDDLKLRISELEAQNDEIKDKIRRICIAERNEYAKMAIKQDFSTGIRELDQENAAEEDEDIFDPTEELRDYDQVAKSLPVFCVSSRAYQKLCGRLVKDDPVPGFTNMEETGIPQLQEHCKNLTVGGRVQTCRIFLSSMSQLLTTFSLWASIEGTVLKTAREDDDRQSNHLELALADLDAGFKTCIYACFDQVRADLEHCIIGKLPQLVKDAIEAAPSTAKAWGERKDRGGLPWPTYLAVVRRHGVFRSCSGGHRDFNADLATPILKNLANGWERAFQTRMPKALYASTANFGRLLHKFHDSIERQADEKGVGLAKLSILKRQVCVYERLFHNLAAAITKQMTQLQREANRVITPTVSNSMHKAYELCANETGPGIYKRMKEHMTAHVDHEREYMFRAAAKTLQKHLDQMCKALQESMEAGAHDILLQLRRDYAHVLGGASSSQPVDVQLKQENELRAEVKKILEGVDYRFDSIRNNGQERTLCVRDGDDITAGTAT